MPRPLDSFSAICAAGQVLTCDADGFSRHFLSLLENAVGTATDIFGSNARQLVVTHGEGDRVVAVLALCRTHAEHVHVVPVERSSFRKVVGTPASVKTWLTSPLASKCGTLYLPCSVGMRLSLRGIHLRVSSSVDQITC